MKQLYGRLRGVFGTAVTWAVGWFGLAFVASSVLGGFNLASSLEDALTYAALGLITGSTFSVVLRLAESGHGFRELRLPRFVLWGSLGALLPFAPALVVTPGLSGVELYMGVTLALFGALTAGGSLQMARSADRQRIPSGARVSLPALTAD